VLRHDTEEAMRQKGWWLVGIVCLELVGVATRTDAHGWEGSEAMAAAVTGWEVALLGLMVLVGGLVLLVGIGPNRGIYARISCKS
jgi:hypothetical protein